MKLFLGIEFSASDQAFRFHEFSTFLHTLSLMTIGGILAFCMEVAEFMVVTYASSLTLAIVGVFKVKLPNPDYGKIYANFTQPFIASGQSASGEMLWVSISGSSALQSL